MPVEWGIGRVCRNRVIVILNSQKNRHHGSEPPVAQAGYPGLYQGWRILQTRPATFRKPNKFVASDMRIPTQLTQRLHSLITIAYGGQSKFTLKVKKSGAILGSLSNELQALCPNNKKSTVTEVWALDPQHRRTPQVHASVATYDKSGKQLADKPVLFLLKFELITPRNPL